MCRQWLRGLGDIWVEAACKSDVTKDVGASKF